MIGSGMEKIPLPIIPLPRFRLKKSPLDFLTQRAAAESFAYFSSGILMQ